MDATLASLIGTAIGAVSGLAGGYLAGRQQSHLEHEKWRRTREDNLEKDIRSAVAELTRKLAAGIHAIGWLTWKAENYPKKITEDDLENYDKDMKSLFPDIVGSRIAVAALSREMHTKMTPLVNALYNLDAQVAKAAMAFKDTQDEGSKALADCYGKSRQFVDEFLEKVTEIVGLDSTKG